MSKKVYLVTCGPYEHYHICCAFSTKKNAEGYLRKSKKIRKESTRRRKCDCVCGEYISYFDSQDIEEYTLDEQIFDIELKVPPSS